MPFQSEKQRRYLWANEPEIARDWTDTYGSRIQKRMGGIMGSNAGSMLVTPTRDGSRPGYYGPDAGHENDPGHGSNAGNGNGNGSSSNREKGIMSRGKGPKGTTGNISGFQDTGPDRSAVGQFSQYGKNVMAQNLQSLQPNLIERGLDLYNKYGLIPNAARVAGNFFGGIFGGTPTGFSTQGDPYGNAPGGLHDYSDPGPTDDRGGEGDNRELYATTNQYTVPTSVEEEEGITTLVNNPNFIQRFRVKNPYRQDKQGELDPQIMEMISKLYT